MRLSVERWVLNGRLVNHPAPERVQAEWGLELQFYDSSGALQRDATRLLCLMFLGTGTVNGACKMYRQAAMETAAASTEFQGLPDIVREELGRINSWLAPE